MFRFTDDDRLRIASAIRDAERHTSGEFVAVVARSSDHYVFIPLLWAAALSLLVPGLSLLFSPTAHLVPVYQLQLLVFVALGLLCTTIPTLHMALIPKAVKHARASRLAHALFYERGIHMTQHHSGVLLFVSLAERYVEIVADQGIHAKVGTESWQAVVDAFVANVRRGAVTDGFVAAVAGCGEAMARHYPVTGGNPDELSDGLIEI